MIIVQLKFIKKLSEKKKRKKPRSGKKKKVEYLLFVNAEQMTQEKKGTKASKWRVIFFFPSWVNIATSVHMLFRLRQGR